MRPSPTGVWTVRGPAQPGWSGLSGLVLLFGLSLVGGCITGQDPGQGSDGSVRDQKVKPQQDGTLPTDKPKSGDLPKKIDGLTAKDAGTLPTGPFITLKKPAAPFSMGAQNQEYCLNSTREQLHLVTLTHGFVIGRTEVTQDEYQTLMGTNPSTYVSTDSSKSTYCGSSSCKNNPVEGVSWHMAAEYTNKLSVKNGLAPCYDCTGAGSSLECQAHWNYATIYACPGYRLPTDAEWEYAYRAGTTSAYYSGDNTSTHCYHCGTTEANASLIAWYCFNSENRTHMVGGRKPNAFGLVDMAGNVWEWVDDWYQAALGTSAVTDPWNNVAATGRVMRGGSYDSDPYTLRGAYRDSRMPKTWAKNIGFRVARTIP